MEYENDFVNTEAQEVEIDGKKFKIRELAGLEADEAANNYTSLIKDEEDPDKLSIEMDLAKRNHEMLKLCVVDAPYKINGKEFKNAKPESRIEILQKLRPGIRGKLLKEIFRINAMDGDTKKNSKAQSSEKK